MRKIEELSKKELCQIVCQIQEFLYLENDGSIAFWNPDKEWNVDLFDSIATTLQEFGLVPKKVEIIRRAIRICGNPDDF